MGRHGGGHRRRRCSRRRRRRSPISYGFWIWGTKAVYGALPGSSHSPFVIVILSNSVIFFCAALEWLGSTATILVVVVGKIPNRNSSYFNRHIGSRYALSLVR